MKTNWLFIAINAVLVIMVGLILGLALGNNIFANSVRLLAFIVLLVALCIPAPIFLFYKKLVSGITIALFLLLGFELVTSILFMIKAEFGMVPYAITQAIGLTIFLAGVLIVIASNSKKSEEENK